VIGVARDVAAGYERERSGLYLPISVYDAETVLLVRVSGDAEVARRALDAALTARDPPAINDIHKMQEFVTAPRLSSTRDSRIPSPHPNGTALEPRPCVRVWPGDPYPLGATWTGVGVNFALFSAHATRVELCLFDAADDITPSASVNLYKQTDMVWHGFLPHARPNQLYGYRVHGPYEPQQGHRFNPNKIVMDPYAKSVARTVRWADEMFGYRVGDPQEDLSFDDSRPRRRTSGTE
jgi:hypothetical protein